MRAIAVLVVAVLFAVACSAEPVSGTGDRGTVAPIPDGADAADQDAEGGEGAPATLDGATDLTAPTPTAVPTPDPEAEPEDRPFQVVTIMDESNVLRPLDAPAVAGVAQRIAELNEDGGLLGRPVELRRLDTESRVSLAQRFSERLLRDPPDLLVVTCDVDFSRPILELADEQGWLTISPCADDIGYSTGAWGPRNFTFGAPAGPRGALAAQVALDRYGTSAMVLRDVTNPEAGQFCTGFERAFRELGGTVAYRDEFSYETPEPLFDRVAERAPQTDFIVLCSHVPGGSRGDGAPNIIQGLRLRGFASPIVSGLSVDEATWFAQVPSLDEMTFISWSSIFGNDPNTVVNELIAAANEDPETPSGGVTTVLGYDTIDAWARAVDAVQSVDPTSVAAALSAFSRETFLTGELSFTSGGRMDVSRTYRVLRVSGNQVLIPEIATVEG